jgi:hypothetical protein
MHNIILLNAYTQCHYDSVLQALNVVMLSVVMLNFVMLNVVMLNVIMLNVIMLNVVMLNVVAPLKQLTSRNHLKHKISSCLELKILRTKKIFKKLNIILTV